MDLEELKVLEGGRSQFEVSLVGRIIRGEISGDQARELLRPKGSFILVEKHIPLDKKNNG